MRAYNEHIGPDEASANTIDVDDINAAKFQSEFYQELTQYNLTEKLERGTDYFLVATIEGIEYYSPNDEGWGGIIAVDHTNKVAVNTTFYEMDDMGYPGSDYAQVFTNGKLTCRFAAAA